MSVLRNASNISRLTMPGGYTLKYLFGNNTFYIPSKLTSVTIADGTSAIVDQAFYGTSISHLTIPSSVTTFGTQILSNASKLSVLTMPGHITLKYLFGNYVENISLHFIR